MSDLTELKRIGGAGVAQWSNRKWKQMKISGLLPKPGKLRNVLQDWLLELHLVKDFWALLVDLYYNRGCHFMLRENIDFIVMIIK
jgi:hypothetical protein